MTLLLLILLVILVFGALPRWEYSSNWGYGPSSVLGIVLLILLVYLLFGSRL
jgi:hypothetical protein